MGQSYTELKPELITLASCQALLDAGLLQNGRKPELATGDTSALRYAINSPEILNSRTCLMRPQSLQELET